MAYEIDGKAIETDEKGYLMNQEQWDKRVAEFVAQQDGLVLTQDHWDVFDYLRDRYFNHGGDLPNMRNMVKGMQERWPERKVDSKTLYELFPADPSKQAGKIAGLPESRRKGGY